MDKEEKIERQEIKRIIDEIDTIMFGAQKNVFIDQKIKKENTNEILVVGALCGASIGVAVSATLTSDILFTTGGAVLGTGIGAEISYLVYYFLTKLDYKIKSYPYYEEAYLNLSREKQLEVLKLSKILVEYYEKEIKNKQNKKYIAKYLKLDNNDTKFDKYEKNHQHFEFLSQEEIDAIHDRGHLTPFEKYNEWKAMNYCPASGGSTVRCNKYGNCRDCTVAWAEEGKEWSKFEFKVVNLSKEMMSKSNNKQKVLS